MEANKPLLPTRRRARQSSDVGPNDKNDSDTMTAIRRQLHEHRRTQGRGAST
jgi:hypothetical protein